jgi:hypothetical protein
MATVLVGATLLQTLATLWLASALVCGCRSPGDGPAAATTGSTPIVNLQSTPLQVPIADAGFDTDEAGAARDEGLLIPLEGYVYESHPEYDIRMGRKVSEDGSLVALWQNLGPNDPEADPSNHYLIVKRVDGDKEVARFLLETYSDRCGTVYASPVCAERKARADAFLSRHKWAKLQLFWLEPNALYPACDMRPQRQRLAFKNLEVTFGELRVVVAKPTGDVLVDRKLPGWRVHAGEGIPPARAFFAGFVGLSLERRVLLIALNYCGLVANADTDTRFHAIRLPETM